MGQLVGIQNGQLVKFTYKLDVNGIITDYETLNDGIQAYVKSLHVADVIMVSTLMDIAQLVLERGKCTCQVFNGKEFKHKIILYYEYVDMNSVVFSSLEHDPKVQEEKQKAPEGTKEKQ